MILEGKERESKKEAIKELRESRKPTINAVSARMKELRKTLDSIVSELRKGGGTVPEIAAQTGIPSEKVMWCVASLKKYGQVVEGEKDGSYFRYHLCGDR
ncbi:MAG: winged helix-turn-helix domain-containing protein [Syntrophobacteraceae bacterium]